MNPSATPNPHPKFLAPGQGPAMPGPAGVQMVLKLTASETNDVISFTEYHCPPGDGSPLHRHTREDETFYVVEGAVTFHIGEPGAAQIIDAPAGSTVFGARGTPHTFKNRGTTTAKLLLIVTPPANFETFYARMMGPAEGGGAPSPAEIQRRVVVYGAEHGIEIMGPNPL